GLEVATAGNGREAMRMVEEDAPDVVVTELTLPIMDGTTFLTRLRQNPYYTGLPAVVLSDRDLTRSEEVVLQEKAHAILRSGPEQARELHRALSWILPLESDGGS
ncbi:MAG TPA: response regulator, partial [Longimicrobiales bacterium]|nr:response regulator [Longimicrobiales bacterium]